MCDTRLSIFVRTFFFFLIIVLFLTGQEKQLHYPSAPVQICSTHENHYCQTLRFCESHTKRFDPFT